MSRLCSDSRRIWLYVLIVLLTIGASELGFVALAAQEQSAQAEDSIVVLDTGMVIQGKISGGVNSYTITRPTGKIVVPLEKVRFRCDTLQEAYQKLRDGLADKQTAASHIDLAKWCLKYRQFSEAREELMTALDLEPDREEVRQMLRRLDEQLKPDQDSTSPRSATRKKQSPEDLELSDVESLGGLSRSAALQFTRQVQPILLHNCGNANCHGRAADSEFRLTMVRPGQGMRRHLVEQNLAMVLRYVNLDNPGASPLLTVPRGSHGPRGKTLFQGPQGNDQVQALQRWVEGLRQEKNLGISLASRAEGKSESTDANPADSEKPTPSDKGVATRSEAASELIASGQQSDSEHPLLKVMKSKTAPAPSIVLTGAEQTDSPPAATKPKPVVAASATKLKPSEKKRDESQGAADEEQEPDPFDPEIFNRQTRRRQRPR